MCANCHRTIDPPGFALESFDPIGGYRTKYRISNGEMTVTVAGQEYTLPAPYSEGAPVDASGVTPTGDAFVGVEDYKQLLVYATGAEICFADRDAVETILTSLRDRGYPMRAMINEVVTSDLFGRQ